MSTQEPVRALSVLARLKLGFRQWKRGSMPDCGCGASATVPSLPTLSRPAEQAKAGRAQAGLAEPVEQDPERLARVAMYALGGYFHSGCLGDMFVSTPDVWIERVGKPG
jgi:hypothetical protein